tara:strand:- start:550 stop:1377 length:828 start_codon:yes stop_codon:yes gene_type:complete
MINNPHIKILILNYNGENIIHQCLESALNLDYDNYSVDVIDNGSSDESVKIIREEFDSVSIHSIDKNLGYAKGYNYGFDKLKNQDFDYYLILNNDTVVVKNLLKNLLININKYGDSNIYGPKICYSNTRKLWFAGGLYNKFLGIAKHVGINEIEDNITYKTNITDYITGCCMLIKKDTIDKLNGFDDSYTMYYEDLDLCHRAYEYDTKCYIIEGDPIYHEVSYTIGAKSFHKKYHMLCSQLKFIYKINNPLFFIISIMINIILMPLFFIKKIVRI